MKRIVLIIVSVLVTSINIFAQDTVRYGDPWYAFNPLPTNPDTVFYYGGRAVQYDWAFPFIQYWNFVQFPIYCYDKGCVVQPYANNNYTLYGIALTMNYWPDSANCPSLVCMAGFHEGVGGTYAANRDNASFDTMLGKIPLYDAPLVKRTTFEYGFGHDAATGGYKVTRPANCYEFYFGEPQRLQQYTDPDGNTVNIDTIWVGGKGEQHYNISSERLPCLYDNDCKQKWVTYSDAVKRALALYLSAPGDNSPTVGYISANAHIWGLVFPIIKPRCTAPKGLHVSRVDGDYIADWPADEDGVEYQVSACIGNTQPDNGVIDSTVGTQLVLPALVTDTIYRIYLRKRCQFTTYSTWSDWSRPVLLYQMSNGVRDVEQQVQFTLSPNPARTAVTIVADGIGEPTQAELYDFSGRLVLTQTINQPGNQTFTLDLSTLPAGVYMLRMLGTVQKIVKI